MEKGLRAETNALDDFICNVSWEELQEELDAWLELQNEVPVRYLTSNENCDIIDT